MRTKASVSKRAVKDYGESVEIDIRYSVLLGVYGDWYGVSQSWLVDALAIDRLERLLSHVAAEFPKGRPSCGLSAAVHELFGFRPERPYPGDTIPVRIARKTRRAARTVAAWYDVDEARVYPALLEDRMTKLCHRMTDEREGLAPRDGFDAALATILEQTAEG